MNSVHSVCFLFAAFLLISCEEPAGATPVETATTVPTSTGTVAPPTSTATATAIPTLTTPTPVTATVKLDIPYNPGAGIFIGPSGRTTHLQAIPRGQSALVFGRNEPANVDNQDTWWLFVEFNGKRGYAWYPFFEWPYGNEAYFALPAIDAATGLPYVSPTTETTATFTPTPLPTRTQTPATATQTPITTAPTDGATFTKTPAATVDFRFKPGEPYGHCQPRPGYTFMVKGWAATLPFTVTVYWGTTPIVVYPNLGSYYEFGLDWSGGIAVNEVVVTAKVVSADGSEAKKSLTLDKLDCETGLPSPTPGK